METFKFKTEYLNHEIINKFLIEKGMKESKNKTDLFYIDGKYQYKKNLINLDFKTIDTLSILDKDSKKNIINKNLLYKTFEKKFPNQYNKYFPEQYYYDTEKDDPNKFKKLFNGKIWIVKPVYGFAGKNIKLINNYNIFMKHIKKDNKWVISEYIKNPLLTKSKKKFHIRIYFIVKIDKNINGFIVKRMPIFTAKKKYKLNDFDLDIHNTHYKDSEKNLTMENYFAKTYGKDNEKYIYQQIIKLFSYILKIDDLKCYTKNCFEIFGADILITDDFRIKLLEINDKIGFKAAPTDYWIKIIYDIYKNNKSKNLYHINQII